nr:hypothetical protein BaRGS_017567 [Batillaria attramentaria]
MSGQFADASYDDIIKDMADIQPHVRLKAIATVGKAAEYKPPSDPGIRLQGEHAEDDPMVAEMILRKTLKSELAMERWAAAQCLAHYGICDSHVVDEMIKQILDSEEPVKHEQGITLLAKISNSTDLTQKLTHLMWHDWHREVRRAAAQCLGKTSHGRDVHDDIRRAIMYGSERIRLEAISRLGQLGIMTAKLLPAFLECFDDPFVSIRSECCITCSNLCIQEEQVVKKLIHLATFDPIWKVKALAIQALGKVGVVNDAIKECLLWAMRYEEKAGVRAEACHALVNLDILDEDVIECLQDRLLVESSQVVRDEMIEALQAVGVNASEDLDTVAQIKMEVRKLCNRNVIASQIVLNEVDDLRQENLQNMIFISEAEAREREEQRKVGNIQRIRDMVSSISGPEMPEPKEESEESSTAEAVSREGTLFTPSADKELEAILGRAEETSEPSGISPSTSVQDLKATSQISIQLSGRHTAVSRETLLEREKLDEQVSNTYLGLSARYNDMVNEITKIDCGLSLARHSQMSSGQSRYLGVPGDFVPQPPGSTTPSKKTTQSIASTSDESKDDKRVNPDSKTPSTEGEAEIEAPKEKKREGLEGKVAFILAVPVSESQMNKLDNNDSVVSDSQDNKSANNNSLMYTSDEDKGEEDTQSAHYSTDYPSLLDDVAPSYIDGSVLDNDAAASTFAESTTYQGGQASEYENSGPSDIENESTLD